VQARLEGRANGSHKALENMTSALEIYHSRGKRLFTRFQLAMGISVETGTTGSDSFEHE